MSDTNTPPSFHVAFEATSSKINIVRDEIKKVVYGQDEVIENALVTLLSGGHMMLLGVPGLAKTKLVSVLSKVMGLDSKRIQCTPDLMPSDMIGAEILEEVDYGRRNFRFIEGPLFCQFLMVDEINRASPRTQSALLQAMEEKHVTITGREHALPTPFHVLATLNPLELEGTYPLPEAQLDRFMMQIEITYPSLQAEKLVITQAMEEPIKPKSIIYASDLREFQQTVRHIPLCDDGLNSLLNLVRAGRPETTDINEVKQYVNWGPGPRAGLALALAIRARAALHGRATPNADDLHKMLKPVLNHRMALNYAARADGITKDIILERLSQKIQKF